MSDINNLRWNVPPKPAVSSQHEFDMMSPEQQAAALHAWQGFWLKPTPASASNSGTRIIVHEPPAHVEAENWKQPPTAEEKQSISDEIWK